MDTGDQDARSETAHRESFVRAYAASSPCNMPRPCSIDYFDVLSRRKHEMTLRYCRVGGMALDICCGTGERLLALDGVIQVGIGLDFVERFLATASRRERTSATTFSFICGSAMAIPLSNHCVDLAFCFATLYAIPDVAAVVMEMSRVVKTGGHCIFDFGNSISLNAVTTRMQPDMPKHYTVSVARMHAIVKSAGLISVEHRCFQVLPLWGDRPFWLRPLLSPGWKRVMQKMVRGRMVDEWLSNAPVLSRLAFRHIIVAKKLGP